VDASFKNPADEASTLAIFVSSANGGAGHGAPIPLNCQPSQPWYRRMRRVWLRRMRRACTHTPELVPRARTVVERFVAPWLLHHSCHHSCRVREEHAASVYGTL